MGPLYFLTLKKVHIFGFRVDDKPMQYNYLIGENETLGLDGTHSHGSDTVISLVHHGLGNYGYGEKECLIHADNCAGQNKNRFLIAYFAWRMITGLHHQISYLMQIVGHTRCLIDAGFARAKKLFRRTDCDSMSELQRVFDQSSTTNKGILYDNGRDSTWKYYDWKEFLGRFFTWLPGISKYHSFRFHADFPGFVFVKENTDSTEKKKSKYKNQMDFSRYQEIFPGNLHPSECLEKEFSIFIRRSDHMCVQDVKINYALQPRLKNSLPRLFIFQ